MQWFFRFHSDHISQLEHRDLNLSFAGFTDRLQPVDLDKEDVLFDRGDLANEPKHDAEEFAVAKPRILAHQRGADHVDCCVDDENDGQRMRLDLTEKLQPDESAVEDERRVITKASRIGKAWAE